MNKLHTFVLLALFGLNFQQAKAQSIATGGDHSLFICSSNKAMAFGQNNYGQLGNGQSGTAMGVANKPTQVSAVTGIVAIAGGDYHSVFLKNDGTVWACGYNQFGELGDGTTTERNTPIQITSLSGVTAISAPSSGCCNYEHTLFLKNDSTVWGCGNNQYGQLGDGTTIERHTPVQVNNLTGIIAIATGTTHSLFLKKDGTVWSCGQGAGNGQTGTGIDSIPKQISGLTGIIAISTGVYHSLFIKNDGTIWSCGNNTYGQLGDGVTGAHTTPVQTTLSGVIAVSAGGNYSLFIKSDSTVWACGMNTYGQLGDGTTNNRQPAFQVSGLTGITEIAAGYHNSIFLKHDGTVWTCGENNWGQIGDSTTTNRYSPVQIASKNSCVSTTTLTGIAQSTNNNAISIYPNPNNGIFTIQSATEISNIEIIDIIGNTLLAQQINAFEATINLSNKAKGIYFYKINGCNNILGTGKLIVE